MKTIWRMKFDYLKGWCRYSDRRF